eukprot:gnl/Trimastix_PCT/371.p1 GENE.gnl/Trimastix_PCT/371~~gnl/Trimastix_PCT/371.p1  ORF type:complete len:228 (+),score=35.63 gnl/Trimastix_PCT/371:97-780(+)
MDPTTTTSDTPNPLPPTNETEISIPDEEPPQTEAENIDYSITHPLQHPWTLFYDNSMVKLKPGENWGDHLQRVFTFDTVEDFWRVFNNITVPSQIPMGSNYHIFKDGIQPMWEDERNKRGGKWILQLDQRNRQFNDAFWLDTVLGLIGEDFGEDSDQICGCVLSLRAKQDKLALWVSGEEQDICMRIGIQWKRILGPNAAHLRLTFCTHADSMKRQSSYSNKPKYQV